MFMAVLLPDSGLTNSINNKLKQMTMRKNFKFSTKTFLGVFAISAVLSMSALTSCNEKPKNEPKPEPEPTPAPVPTPEPNGGGNTPGGGSSSEITMNISLANDTTVYLLAGEKYRVSYEISKGDISLEGQTSGWSTSKLEENGKKFVEITTPESSNLNGNKTFDLVMGSADKQDMPKITAHFKVIDITERGGTFILFEGTTKETGSISYISPDGVLIDTVYRRVNKTKLGTKAKDFFMHDGKGYIISQTGVTDKGEDGMLVIVDLKSLKKIAAFSNDELSQLSKPRYVASLDGNNIYIMDEKSLWHLDAKTKALTKMEDLSGTPNVPFVEQNGKLYYASEKKYFGATIKEITSGEKTAKEIKLPYSSHMNLKKIVDVMPTGDGKLWLVGYYPQGSEDDLLGRKLHYSIQKIDPQNPGRKKLPCNWIHVELPEFDDYHKVAIGSNNTIYYRNRAVVYRLEFDENATPTIKNDEVGRFVKFEKTPEAIKFADYNKLLGDSRLTLRSGFAVNPVTNNIFAYTHEVYGMSPRNKRVVELDGASGVPSKPLKVWSDVVGNYVAGFFFNK